MIKIERLDERLIKSYSDSNKKIKPIFDRLGEPINESAIYNDGVAIDIIVIEGGKEVPRNTYVETNLDIDPIEMLLSATDA